MDADRAQEVAERDQLWASLRPLLPRIDQLAGLPADPGNPDAYLIVLLAKIVGAELRFRERHSTAGGDPI